MSGVQTYVKSMLQKHGRDIGMWTVITAMATMLGAFGGFPDPPPQFLWLTQFPLFQWSLVFILIYQGGAGQDPLLSIGITLATFLIYQMLKWVDARQRQKRGEPSDTEPVETIDKQLLQEDAQ